jgi:hypothetical protein
MKYIYKLIISAIVFFIFSASSFALQERHVIFVRQGGEYASTSLGKEQIQQTGEILLTHGFDNRTIMAVYVGPDQGSFDCANQLSKIGLFEKDKIHQDDKMDLAFYDSLIKRHQKGHVIIVDDSFRTGELIEVISHHPVDRSSHQPYIIPFLPREA